MPGETKRFYLSIATFVGTVIGVGVFGIPYAIQQVGWGVAIGYFVVLGAVQLLQSMMYAEAAIAEKSKMRMVGLVDRFLGPQAKKVASMALILGFWGGMIAYILVGGTFLHALLYPILGGPEFMYQLVWALIGALVIFIGLDFIAKFQLVSTVLMLLVGALIFFVSLPHVAAENLVMFTGADWFLPYGVILFSLGGTSAVAEMEDIMEGRHTHFRAAIAWGAVIATAMTAAFGFVIYGVTGASTTQDAIIGLYEVVGGIIPVVGAVFGFLAVSTSYMTTGINLRETFEFDYKMPKFSSWLVATGVPIGIFLLGAKSFIGIIGFTGAVFGGIVAILIALMYQQVLREHATDGFDVKPLRVPAMFVYASIALLTLGAGYSVVTTIAGWLA